MVKFTPVFCPYPLRLLNPAFASPMLDVLTELEHLRRLHLQVSTPMPVFLQLKQVFHLLESLASARIEGNHTTLADFVEAQVQMQVQTQVQTAGADAARTDQLQEIDNIEAAMRQVEDAVAPGEPITEHLLRGLHATAVQGLQREGDRTPGAWRSGSVQIAQAMHLPPDALQVPAYMAELVAFINQADAPKYDLMKVALAHHRFAWVHPFANGNGRVVRLLTYALLRKYGFQVSMPLAPAAALDDTGRLLNPAAVFCADRSRYYTMLAEADSGTDTGLEAWCTYVLAGVRDELMKLDRLADHRYLQQRVLLPALAFARQRQMVTAQEDAVLNATVRAGVVKAGDLAAALPKLNDTQRTYQIRKLVDSGLLQPTHPGARQYVIGFTNNVLLRGVVRALTDEGFISAALAAPPPPGPSAAA